MAKNPILPLYYNDINGSTQDWTDEEFGAYMRLLIYQWDKGFIPKEFNRLKKIADSAEKNWTVLSQKFTPDEQGFLKNSVMEKIRIDREKFLSHQSNNGKLGGRPPKNNPKNNPKKSQTITQLKAKKKPLEDEDEIEEEVDNEKEIEMPFTSEKFRISWQDWKDYRKVELKKGYKSIQSEQAALSHLQNLSGDSEEKAIAIIKQSQANQWQGLFELKNNTNGLTTINGSNKAGTSDARTHKLSQW